MTKKAKKFFKKLSAKEQQRIKEKLVHLLDILGDSGVIPFNELDIKNLEGEWDGFMRIRVGKIRVIFDIDETQDILRVYDAGFRGDIYKSAQIIDDYILRMKL